MKKLRVMVASVTVRNISKQTTMVCDGAFDRLQSVRTSTVTVVTDLE